MAPALTVRTFTPPGSLNESLAAAATKMSTNDQKEAKQENPAKQLSPPSQIAKDVMSPHAEKESKPGITFAHQEKLPKLPIPELESSCSKYLAAVRPLQTPREYQDTCVAVQEFLKADGPRLQEKLKAYAADKANYIEQFCKLNFHQYMAKSLAHRSYLLP